MASLLPPSAYNSIQLRLPCKNTKFCQVKAQSYRDRHEAAGRSSDMIETNLRVLRSRIEEAKKKERLERCLVAEHGWNYNTTNTTTSLKLGKRNNNNNNEIIEVVRMVGATFGLTIFSCTSCLCLASLILASFT